MAKKRKKRSKLHPIEIWRLEMGIETKVEAAEILDMGRSQYGDMTVGRTNPSLKRIRSIYEITDGAISVEDIVWWEP